MRVGLFVSSDFASRTILEEALRAYSDKITYLAYMSRGIVGGGDSCIKAFAMDLGIQSCPFICSSFSQLTGLGSSFDLCIVLRRADDTALQTLAAGMNSVFPVVEEICYGCDPQPPPPRSKSARKLSVIAEE